MIKVILFDFDGVIVESVDIKTEAFESLFKNENEGALTAIVDYHKKHGGVSRTKKIIHYYNNIFKRELTDEKLKELEDEFSRIVKQKVINAPYVNGALEFIEENHSKYDFYIVSGTPQAELEEIVAERGLSKYFIELHGSPPGKAEIINSILSSKHYSKNDTVFIGDSADDLTGAEESGVKFIARVNPLRSDNVFPDIVHPVMHNFSDLMPVISGLDAS